MTGFKFFAATAVLISAHHLSAALINFDDLDASAGDIILDNLSPYHGFTWSNFSVYTNTPGFPGFNSSIKSSPNAAYSGGEILGSAVAGKITAPDHTFDFTGAELGSGYYDDLAVTVQGFRGSTRSYTRTLTVNTAGAQAFSFNFTGIDALVFSAATTSKTTDPYSCGPVNCTQFTLDDLNLTLDVTPPQPVVPEPGTLACLCAGALVLVSLGRYRHNQQ